MKKTRDATKTATFIKALRGRGDVRLYRLDPPMPIGPEDSAQYVAISAVSVPYSGPEIYMFKTDAKGKVLDGDELPGSSRGEISHAEALAAAGYTVAARGRLVSGPSRAPQERRGARS